MAKSKKYAKRLDFSSLSSEDKKKILELLRLQELLESLAEEELVRIKGEVAPSDALIPISVFCRELGTIETICKYLKENKNLTNKKISLLIGRDSKSVWQAYNSSKKKLPAKFEIIKTSYSIPVSVLQNKKLGALENIVVYLKDNLKLNYHEIGLLLKRDERTIWSAYKNSMEKYAKQ